MDRRFDSPMLSTREIDRDGFLHLPVRVIGIGTLHYEDGYEHITLENVSEEEFLKSIQGKPILRNKHQWKSPSDMTGVIGNFSGVPEIKDGFVVCDAIITDKKAIEDIQSRLLCETSAGYRADIGNDSVQRNLRCNHLVLCKYGEARGGREMKVGNTKKQAVKPRAYNIRVNTGTETYEAIARKGQKTVVKPVVKTVVKPVVKPVTRQNALNIGNGRMNQIEKHYLTLMQLLKEQSRYLEDLEVVALSENDKNTIQTCRGDIDRLRAAELEQMRRFSEVSRMLRKCSK